MDGSAIPVQLAALPAAVVETMEVHLHALRMEGTDLVEDLENTAIICREGHVKCHYMEMLVQSVKNFMV